MQEIKCTNARIRKYNNTGMQERKNAKNAKIPKTKNLKTKTQEQKQLKYRIHKYIKRTRKIQKCRNEEIPKKYKHVKIHSYKHTKRRTYKHTYIPKTTKRT